MAYIRGSSFPSYHAQDLPAFLLRSTATYLWRDISLLSERSIFLFFSSSVCCFASMADKDFKDDAVNHIEKVEKGLAASSTTSSDPVDVKLAAKIRHRIDWRLIPALGAMYGML